MNKKGFTIGDLYPIVLTLVLVSIVLGVGIVVLTQMSGTTGITGTPAANALANSSDALATIPNSWMGIIVLVIVAGLIIGIVVTALVMKQRR